MKAPIDYVKRDPGTAKRSFRRRKLEFASDAAGHF